MAPPEPTETAATSVRFVSASYLFGATLAAIFAGILFYASFPVEVMGLTIAFSMLGTVMVLATFFAAGRGWVQVDAEPRSQLLLIKRGLRPAIRLPMSPGAIRVRPSTYLDRAVGPVLVKDEALSKKLHGIADTLINSGRRVELVRGDDADFVVFELSGPDAEARTVLVPASSTTLSTLATQLGAVVEQVEPESDHASD